jgi:hypothetical protein
MNTHSMKKMRCLSALTAFLGFGLIANPVAADILLAKINTLRQSHKGAQDLDLGEPSGVGSEFLARFRTFLPNRMVRVIFSAEGAIQGPPSFWLDATIFIDPVDRQIGPVACPPTDQNTQFISGNGITTDNDDGLVSAVVQCFIQIPTDGVHTIRVQVTPHPAGAVWEINDLSLIIDDE